MLPRTKKLLLFGAPAFLLAAGLAGYAIFGPEKTPVYETAAAARGNVVEEVGVSGQVTPAEQVDLSFERSGKVATVAGKVGERVAAGHVLVALDNADLVAQLRQAQAGVDGARATLRQYEAALARAEVRLEEVKRGSRTEEIDLAKTRVANAKEALGDAEEQLAVVRRTAEVDIGNLYDEVGTILADVYTKIDNAFNSQLDALFLNDTTGSPQLTFTADGSAKSSAETGRGNANGILQAVGQRQLLLSSQESRDAALTATEQELTRLLSILSDIMSAVNAAAGLSADTASTYKVSVAAARANINTALTSVSAHRQAIASQTVANETAVLAAEKNVNNARQALAVAEQELLLKQAGPTGEQIRTQEAEVAQAKANLASQAAQVRSAQATVANIQAQIEKTLLRAPLEGVITALEARVGEITSGNTPIASLISPSAFDVEAYIAEVDIVKVALGNPAMIALDAYGDSMEFAASVTAIDPAETEVDGVAAYKVTFQFSAPDERIKSGMTANVTIETDRRNDVLVIPVRAVQQTTGGEAVVRLLDQQRMVPVEKIVELGIRGSQGDVEVRSGLEPGDIVILAEKK